MKILHVEAGKFLYGGARQVQYIVEGLAARGIDNLLACPTGSDSARQQPAGRALARQRAGEVGPQRVAGAGRAGVAAGLRHAG